MSEPRFERHQLGDVLQKAAELQEGRADAGEADRLGLQELQHLTEENIAPSAARESEGIIGKTGFYRLLSRLLPRIPRR